MEIKRLAHRKAVILFSVDQTTTEIEFSLGKHRPWGIREWTPPPEQESVHSLGRKHWGPWADWPGAEKQEDAGRWAKSARWGRCERGLRLSTELGSLSRNPRGMWWSELAKTRFQQSSLKMESSHFPPRRCRMNGIDRGAWSNTVWWNLWQYNDVGFNTGHSLKAESYVSSGGNV